MVILAILLSFLVIRIDVAVGDVDISWLAWMFDTEPDGAREVLSTIAGSMITVAGVVFSITLVTVSNAAARLSPRLLTNFMRDPANQITLGTFISTFVFNLLILRAVRSAPSIGDPGQDAIFVPHIGVVVGLVLAMSSIAVMIYFIHHIPRSIHVSSVLASIGEELCRHLDSRFPSSLGKGEDVPDISSSLADYRRRFSTDDGLVRRVQAKKSGYIRIIETSDLMKLATKADLSVLLLVSPGDFVADGQDIMLYRANSEAKTPDLDKPMRAVFSVGALRTPVQDTGFLMQELSEIAMRALSPGINDPVSAITALNWIRAGLSLLAQRQDLSPVRHDDDGTARIVSPVTNFDRLVEGSLGVIGPDFARSVPAARAFLSGVRMLRDQTEGERRKKMDALTANFKSLVRETLNETEVQLVLDEPKSEKPKGLRHLPKRVLAVLGM
ncbi:MAG: hypothetical protein CMK07_15970 [Ponticaulis sp.]|nr:hypothetical protein [Ponticaulis sp.]